MSSRGEVSVCACSYNCACVSVIWNERDFPCDCGQDCECWRGYE